MEELRASYRACGRLHIRGLYKCALYLHPGAALLVGRGSLIYDMKTRTQSLAMAEQLAALCTEGGAARTTVSVSA